MKNEKEPRIVLLSEFLDLVILDFDKGVKHFEKPPYSYPVQVMDELQNIYQRLEVLYFKLTVNTPATNMGFYYYNPIEEYEEQERKKSYFSDMHSLIQELKDAYYAYIDEFDVVPDYLMLTGDMYACLEAELANATKEHRPWIDDINIIEMANSKGWLYIKK